MIVSDDDDDTAAPATLIGRQHLNRLLQRLTRPHSPQIACGIPVGMPRVIPRKEHRMARLAAQAELGFVPTPVAIEDALLSYVAAPAGFTGRIVDPCAGKGVMIGAWGRHFGISRTQVYLNELHDGRAEACREHSAHVLPCDALKSLQATPALPSSAYVNPPFDTDSSEEGGGRLEPKFFRRVVEEGKWIQPGGIVVLDLAPGCDGTARMPQSYRPLVRRRDDLGLTRRPSSLPRGDRVRRRTHHLAHWQGAEGRSGTASHTAGRHVANPDCSSRAALSPSHSQGDQNDRLARCQPWQHAAIAQHDVVRSGGAWISRRYRTATRAMDRTTPMPLFPLTKGQAALRIADGLINGETVELAGRSVEIKGSTVEEEHTWVEERETGRSHIVETHKIVRRAPHVTTIDGEGRIGRYVGDKGIAKLMETPGAAEVLLGAVKRKAPPLYQLDMNLMLQRSSRPYDQGRDVRYRATHRVCSPCRSMWSRPHIAR